MVTLEVGDKKLVTGNNFSCRINIKNPAWMFDGIPGPIAADITLPAIDNAGKLNHPSMVTKRGKQNDRHFSNAVLKKHGIPLIPGDFIVTSAVSNIEGWIQSNIGKLGEKLREKTLRDINILPDQTFTNKSTFDPDTDSWCTIKIMNRGFWKDKGKMSEENPDAEELTEKFKNTSSFFVNQNGTNGIITSAGTDGVVVVSPFPFVHRLIDKIFRENQFYISENFLQTNADLKTLCLYHNWNIVADDPTTTPASFDFYHFFRYTLETLDLDKISSATWSLGAFNLFDLLPDISLKDFALSLQNMANVFFWTNSNRTMQVIDRESIFSMTPFALGKYRVTEWETGERKNSTLKFAWKHDNSDSAFNDEFTNLDDKRGKFKTSVDTLLDLHNLTTLPYNGDIRLVEAENRYYEYGWHTFTQTNTQGEETEIDARGWKPVSIGLQNYFFNDNNEEKNINTSFSTLRMSEEGHPVVYQNGNSKTFSSVNEPFSTRLLFYKGNNTGGDESPSGMRFDWKGTNGILRKRWRLTAPFLANALPLKAQFRLPTNVLKYVIDNLYQLFSDPECHFVIRELDAEPGPNDETLVEVSAFKIEDNFWASNPGTVVGGGEGTNTDFTPKFIGVNKYGKPYLINESGTYLSTSIFGNISQAPFAHNCAADYDPANNQLIIGGENGFIHIYDLNSNFRMNTVRVVNSANSVSAVKVIGTNIFVGSNTSSYFYVLPVQANIDLYADFSSTAVELVNGNTARDFALADGSYYCCTQAGEIFKGTTPTTGWSEIADWAADFTRLSVTTTKIYAWGANERHFYCLRSNTSVWYEFRQTAHVSGTVPVLDTASQNDQATIIIDAYDGVIIVDAPEPEFQNQYDIFSRPKGVVYASDGIHVCGEDFYTGIGKMNKFNGTSFDFLYNLPNGMKLFNF